MKKLFKISMILLFLFLGYSISSAQGINCNTPSPFCSNGLDPYPAGVNNPAAPVGNNYDCLFTQPNPAWFYLTISRNGTIDFTLDNTAGLDIDFILYGPFPNIAAAINQCGNLGNGGASGAVAACSYSSAAVEPVTVANVQAGQVYILLITNFSNQPTNIFATPNVGSGDYACDCETSVHFAEAPAGFNDAVLLDTTEYSVDFAVCSGEQVGFTIDVAADTITDSLGIYLPATNLGDVFGAGNVTVFGPIYPIPGRFDTANFVVFINATPSNIGQNQAIFSVLNSGCVQDLIININVIGVDGAISDTSLCAAISQDVQLFGNTTALAGGAFQWSQVSGPVCNIAGPTNQNPIVSVPATTVAGDSAVFAVSFQSAPDSLSGLSCTSSDTVVVYFVASPLSVQASASDFSLCQNGLPNTVQFSSNASGPGIDSTLGVYSWTSNPPSFVNALSSTSISNPVGQIAGSPGGVVQYYLNYNYGACSGRDTVTLLFGNWTADVTPASPVICSGTPTNLSASPGQSTCGPTYNVNNIAYAPYFGSALPVPFSATCFSNDDCLSDPIPIGFSFEFFCTPYTQLEVSSNGFVTFDLGSGNSGCCTGENLPTNGGFGGNNLIALAWSDLNPDNCGNVRYFTTGTAPNRRFVIDFDQVCYFGGTAPAVDGQIVLHETTNIIEIFSTNIQPHPFSNNVTQGIENAGGTVGYGVPGRNASIFTATNDGWRFTPQLTFLPTYAWSPNTQISATNTQNVTVSPLNTTTYTVSVSEGGCTMVDSAVVTVQNTLAAPVVSCGTPTTSSVTFNWNSITGASSYEYSINGGTTWISVGSNTSVTIGGLAQNTVQNILVRAVASSGPCPTGPAGAQSCTSSNVICNVPGALVSPIDNSFCLGSNSGVQVDSVFGGNLPFVIDLGNGLVDTITASGQIIFEGIALGNYQANLIELSTGCLDSNAVSFTISDISALPQLNAFIGQTGQDSACILLGESIILNAGANQIGVNYSWSPSTGLSSTDSSNVTVLGVEEGSTVYIITADGGGGCISSDSIILCVNPVGFLGLPSAFSPNNDGLNDNFGPVGLVGADVSRFEIYSRWGQLVHESSDGLPWDGKRNGQEQPRDVYIYIFEYKFPADPEPKTIRGVVTLLK
jgi:gliding motility-associated-like protein